MGLIILFSLSMAWAQTEEVRVYQKGRTEIGKDRFTDQITSFSLIQGQWTIYFSAKGGPFTLPEGSDLDAWKSKLEKIQSSGAEVEVTFHTQSDEIISLNAIAKSDGADSNEDKKRAPASASAPPIKAIGPWSQKDIEDILKAVDKKK